jgi:hypothetical protein
MRYKEFITEGTASNLRDIDQMAKKKGYHRIGKGADATVYTNDDNTDFVIKILTGGPYSPDASARTFMKFYNFCRKNANVPYLPKFGPLQHIQLGIPKSIEKFYHTRMEKLQPIDKLNWNAMNFLLRQAGKNRTWNEVSKMIHNGVFNYEYSKVDLKKTFKSPKLKEFLLQDLKQWKDIFYLIKLLNRKKGQSAWDPHRGNIMQRDDGTPVIIDPWVD